MIGKLLPSVLCIFLSPLLVAQETAQQGTSPTPASTAPIPPQITLFSDAGIHIIAPGNPSFARMKPGTTVRFFSDSDVVVNGVKVIAASVPVEGVVEKVVRASRFRNRSAQIFIRVGESASGAAANILLRCDSPESNREMSPDQNIATIAITSVLDGFAIVGILVLVFLVISL